MTLPIGCNQSHNLVTVDYSSVLVANDEAVGIAIKRNADIGFFRPHRVSQEARIGGTTTLIFILNPFGDTPMETTSAPNSQSAVGATL